MSEVAVVNIGYYSYTVSDDFLPAFLEAIASGKIREVTKHHANGDYKVVIGKAISSEVARLAVVTSEEADAAALKAKISELEKKLNG